VPNESLCTIILAAMGGREAWCDLLRADNWTSLAVRLVASTGLDLSDPGWD
jgi:hypothetical protein